MFLIYRSKFSSLIQDARCWIFLGPVNSGWLRIDDKGHDRCAKLRKKLFLVPFTAGWCRLLPTTEEVGTLRLRTQGKQFYFGVLRVPYRYFWNTFGTSNFAAWHA